MYGVGSEIDGRGEFCSAVMILGINALSCLFELLNSAMRSMSLIWMNDVVIEMGIRKRIMFLWSLRFFLDILGRHRRLEGQENGSNLLE